MNARHQFMILAFLFFGSTANAQTVARVWEPVVPGMVFTRNFMVPESPAKEGYRLLPGEYQLGSLAYGKAPPAWWLKMVADAGIGDERHPKDFPLAYAGEFKSKSGSTALLVVQIYHAFTGDGFYKPGPELYLVSRMISLETGVPKVLHEKTCRLGSLQYSRLLAGQADGRKVVFWAECGSAFNGREVVERDSWTLIIDDDNALR